MSQPLTIRVLEDGSYEAIHYKFRGWQYHKNHTEKIPQFSDLVMYIFDKYDPSHMSSYSEPELVNFTSKEETAVRRIYDMIQKKSLLETLKDKGEEDVPF